jgi:outer membrane protein OmpA-like peptidoglycan-associated protein
MLRQEGTAVGKALVAGLMLAVVVGGCETFDRRSDEKSRKTDSPWTPGLHGSMPVRDGHRGGYWWQPSLGDTQKTGNKGVVYSRGPARRERVRETPVFAESPVAGPVISHGYRLIERIVLDHVMYDYDRAVLKPPGKKEVRRAAKYMVDHPEVSAVIEGHTDWIASEKYNLALGQRRAETVRDVLVKAGVSPDRMTVISYGESQPVADNKTEEGRASNRRAVIDLIAPDN